MTKTEKAVAWIKQIAADNSHGYLWGGWGPKDYDCGHLVITAWQEAGVPVKTAGSSYTGNMKRVFMSCGFKDVTTQVNLKTGAGMKAGDVLVNEKNHAAMCVGNGKIVQARSNLDGKTGDSSGNEIREQAYYNYPWDVVLRYAGDESADSGGSDEIPVEDPKDEKPSGAETYTLTFHVLKYGAGMGDQAALLEEVRAMQQNLKALGFDIGPDGCDGKFGSNTKVAVVKYQRSVRLPADGIFGRSTRAAMTGVKL